MSAQFLRLSFALAVLCTAGAVRAQVPASQGGAVPFEQAAQRIQAQLEQSVAELNALRERIATEKVPMQQRLSALESELLRERAEYQTAARAFDSRTLDLANLRNEIKARQEEGSYLSNLLAEYQRNLESRLHIVEQKRFAPVLEAAKLAQENRTLPPEQVYGAQVAVLARSLERLEEALGGARFDGTAVDANGTVQTGAFALFGPVAVFRSLDGTVVGTAEQRLGSLEPTVLALPTPELTAGAAQLVATGTGTLPLDATLGNAHKIAALQDSLWVHLMKGGPVMYPILGLAALALVVALLKWLSLVLVRSPAPRKVQALLAAVARRDRPAAELAAAACRGPAGAMLQIGVDHLGEPRELVEEVMYESMLATRLRLNSWLPFIAITSSSAPLLGLLGTVTGIMNTFTLMTAFGAGDPKVLSSGISEALITTESGLYVAIPSLLLYALLSRKSKRIQDRMEQCAVAFVNQLGKNAAPAAPEPVATGAA
jgi:biopolymer transport protein ExbB